jgi:hypothetical protein
MDEQNGDNCEQVAEQKAPSADPAPQAQQAAQQPGSDLRASRKRRTADDDGVLAEGDGGEGAKAARMLSSTPSPPPAPAPPVPLDTTPGMLAALHRAHSAQGGAGMLPPEKLADLTAALEASNKVPSGAGGPLGGGGVGILPLVCALAGACPGPDTQACRRPWAPCMV